MRLAVGGVRDHAQRGQLEGEQLVLQLGDPGRGQRVVQQGQAAGDAHRAGVVLGLRQHPLGRAHRRDADALVAEQELRVVPALVELADEVLGRDADVLEPHLVDLVAAVDQLDRPDRHAGGGHVDEQERDAGLLLGLGVGADQVEDPVAVLPEGGPGLLAVDDELVAVADRGGAQRGEVGAGVGLGEALAPPDVEVRGLRQEALLLLLRAERRDHRADHRGVERQRRSARRRAASPRARCAGAAGTSRGRPTPRASAGRRARRVEHPLGLDDLLLGELAALRDGVADLLGDLGGEEGPHLVAERGVLGGQLELHRRTSGVWVPSSWQTPRTSDPPVACGRATVLTANLAACPGWVRSRRTRRSTARSTVRTPRSPGRSAGSTCSRRCAPASTRPLPGVRRSSRPRARRTGPCSAWSTRGRRSSSCSPATSRWRCTPPPSSRSPTWWPSATVLPAPSTSAYCCCSTPTRTAPEAHDLAEQHPEKVEELKTLWLRRRRSTTSCR